MILVDPRNPVAARYAERLNEAMPEGHDDPDVIVVIGGDGFMLQSVGQHGLRPTYVGLNAGRVGFLLNDVTDWSATADRLRRRAWRSWQFPVLAATIRTLDGAVHQVQALNDVVLERSTGQTAHLRLCVDGEEVVDTLVADGIIFATALGSTAYTFSAGGPACHPTLPALAVTAICPHKPRLSPMVLPAGTTARVEVRRPEHRPVRGVADGQHVEGVVDLSLGLADDVVRFAWFEGTDLTSRMVGKILRP